MLGFSCREVETMVEQAVEASMIGWDLVPRRVAMNGAMWSYSLTVDPQRGPRSEPLDTS